MSKPATMKAVSYGPVPLKKAGAGAGLLAQDDWMVEAAKPMWGLRGRDDLGIIGQLGANTIRLYGNNPKLGICKAVAKVLFNAFEAEFVISCHDYGDYVSYVILCQSNEF